MLGHVIKTINCEPYQNSKSPFSNNTRNCSNCSNFRFCGQRFIPARNPVMLLCANRGRISRENGSRFPYYSSVRKKKLQSKLHNFFVTFKSIVFAANALWLYSYGFQYDIFCSICFWLELDFRTLDFETFCIN